MNTQTTNAEAHPDHHLFEQQFDMLKASVKKLVDRATTKPTWFGRSLDKTSTAVKAHPVVAIGIAVGLGYAVIRIARR